MRVTRWLALAVGVACGGPTAPMGAVPVAGGAAPVTGGVPRTGGLVTPVTGDPPGGPAVISGEYVVRSDAEDSCPSPTAPGWTVAPLFDGDDDDDDELGRYCRYENAAGSGGTPFLGLPDAAGATQDLSAVGFPGARGVAGRLLLAPSGVDTAAARSLHAARFAAFAGAAIRLGGRQAPPAVPPSRQPRVVVVDTALQPSLPFPYELSLLRGPAGHGRALARAVQSLTCPDLSRCPVQIDAAEALTRSSVVDRGDAPAGSAWGTPGDLAAAIVAAVRRWQLDRGQGRVGPLILNLSVGWHPYFGGGVGGGYTIAAAGEAVDVAGGGTAPFAFAPPDAWPPDVAAVFAALRLARCEGALIFAAAGNVSAGPRGLTGPLLPAGWEAVDPSVITCPDGPLPEPALPLLHAVGGVDADGADLPVARPESRPKLTAYGDHHASSAAWSDPDAALSGTSVATAVVSSAAAMVAAELSAPTAGAILRRLLTRADLGAPVASWVEARTAALAPGLVSGPGAGSRVVRVCDVLTRGYRCPAPAPAFMGFGEGDDPVVGELTWATPETLPMCGAWTVHRDTAAGAPLAFNPCPHLTRWSVDVAPWVLPQPPTEGCSSCFLDVSARRLGLDPARFAGWTDLTLRLRTASDGRAYALPALSPGAPVVWGFRAGAVPAGVRSADVVGVVEERTVVVPVAIVGR